jgi:choline monooxygenase
MSEFDIDTDIRRARTLPSRFYTEQRYFDVAREKIFSRCWHFVGRRDDLQDLEPIFLLPDLMDEPILISKAGGSLFCLSNVCTHRGKILVENRTEGNLIRCGYHGRRFSLDGKFLSMPEFEGVENFPGESDDLHQYALADRVGFLFVSCDPVADFDDFVGDARETLLKTKANDLALTGSKEYEVAAHWALYCENYLEGFHIPYVHKGLNELVDYGTYTTETFRYSSLQTGFDDNGNIAGQYLFVFPNLMLNFYPWGISVNVVEPISMSRSRIRYLTFVSDERKFGTGAGADLHRVELEDEAIVESVQKGIRSRFYDRGRYSPTREQGTHHFHRLISEFISDGK